MVSTRLRRVSKRLDCRLWKLFINITEKRKMVMIKTSRYMGLVDIGGWQGGGIYPK